MKQHRKLFGWAGLLILLLALIAVWAPFTPAHATGGDTLTLAMANGATFPYGGTTTPTFTATLVLAQPFVTGRFWTVWVQLDGSGQRFANVDPPGESADKLTYIFTIPTSGTLIMPGNHPALATFDNYDTGVTTTSNSVSFTIAKASMSLGCGMNGGSSFQWKPGQSEQVVLLAQNTVYGTPVDWTQGTATVWFVGPTTVTESSLQPDSSGNVTVTTPTQIGWYALNCSFTGTTYYAPSQMTSTGKDVLISQMQALGGIQLYTNPTTLVANKATQMYVVFKAAPSLPAPTGEFIIYIGQGANFYHTQSIKISANGTALVTVGAIPNLYNANTITITYWGDQHYKAQSVNFTLTNPAIPNGGGGGGGGGDGATPSVTPSATVTPSAQETASATSSVTPTPSASPSAQGAFGPLSGGWMIALLIVFALVVVGGGTGTFALLSRRGARGAGSGGAGPISRDL